jgi:hypothetical protein
MTDVHSEARALLSTTAEKLTSVLVDKTTKSVDGNILSAIEHINAAIVGVILSEPSKQYNFEPLSEVMHSWVK